MAITLRCTQVVRRRLRLSGDLPAAPGTTAALGDWYIHLVRFGRQQVILATSERSLLTVFLPARDLRDSLVPNLQTAVFELLLLLDVPAGAARAEVQAMSPASFGIAINRRVLGSMNQLAHDASWVAGRYSDPLALALHLSNTPMSALGAKKGDYGYPDKVTQQLMQLHLPAKGAGH
jgi:hypothetical protein